MTTMVNASSRLSAWLVITTAMASAIGPVGPEICARVPPKTAASSPKAIAPYMPSTAPKPEATPKASAVGSPTTAAVMPPKASSRKLCRS